MASKTGDTPYTVSSSDQYDMDDPPVVAVPGFGDSTQNSHWQRFIDELDAAGYDGPVEDVAIDTPWASPQYLAGAVQETVETTAEAYDTTVNVVAHSMGGLTARWYIEECGGDEYVDTLVTLGTPHQGSHNAWAVPYTGGGQAMLVGSPFLEDLNTDLSEDVDYTAIYSTTDEAMTVPFWSPVVQDVERGRLPHAAEHENAENIVVHGYGHFDLLTDDDILDLYLDDLTADD